MAADSCESRNRSARPDDIAKTLEEGPGAVTPQDGAEMLVAELSGVEPSKKSVAV